MLINFISDILHHLLRIHFNLIEIKEQICIQLNACQQSYISQNKNDYIWMRRLIFTLKKSDIATISKKRFDFFLRQKNRFRNFLDKINTNLKQF